MLSIHLLTKCQKRKTAPQNCAYCAQSCRSNADIEKYKWVDDENYMEITHLSMIINFPVIVSD